MSGEKTRREKVGGILKTFLWIFVAELAAIYVIFAVCVYLFPDHFFYKPNTEKPNIAAIRADFSNMREISYKTIDDRDGYAWFNSAKGAKKAVIFMHGNAYNIEHFVGRMKPFINAGYAVMMVEYAGFGGLSGKITEDNLAGNAAGAVRYLNERGFQNKDIVLYGHSLGTYVAVRTAAEMGREHPFNAVILEAPFTSLKDVADWASFYIFPVSMIIRDKYDSHPFIGDIGTRVFIGHGERDQTIPYRMGQKMYDKARGDKTFFSSDLADHNTLPQHGFLDAAVKWLGKK